MCKANFTEEFKRDAVRQITERGYPVSEVSQRMVWGEGHNVSHSLLSLFEDRLVCTLVLSYSRTEGGLTYNHIEQSFRSFDHNGFPNRNSTEIAIFAEDGKRRCHSGEQGETAVRGDGVTPGYWDGNMIRKVVSHDGGWQPTGNLGTIDLEGALTFHGRQDEMIKTGGENVYPSEVLAVLQNIPCISDAVVFGLPDPRLGQKVAALVIRSDDSVGLKEIDIEARRKFGGFKVPRAVAFVDEIPRLGSQKSTTAAAARY